MTDDIFQQNPMPMPETDGEEAFLMNIMLDARKLTPEQIQIKYDLTDEQMADEKVIKAIKKGSVLIADKFGDKMIELAENGNFRAMKYLFEINDGKQAPKKYNFDYKSKDQAMLENAEKNANGNIFAAMAN